MNELKQRFEREAAEVEKQVRTRILTYLGAGLGFVAGLAWNDAISSLIKYLFPTAYNGLIAKFAYAVGITVIITIFLVYLEKILREKEKSPSQ